MRLARAAGLCNHIERLLTKVIDHVARLYEGGLRGETMGIEVNGSKRKLQFLLIDKLGFPFSKLRLVS